VEEAAIRAEQVSFGYADDIALDDVSLAIEPGRSVAIVGPSGSGKSTLLYVLAGLLPPRRGRVVLGDIDLYARSDAERSRLRGSRFGFVFQFSELLPELTLIENVALPLRLAGVRRRTAEGAAGDLLALLGIGSLGERRPASVSGGEQQRAAVARALVHEPDVVFADEPTGALDSDNAGEVMRLLVEQCATRGASLIVVTHDPQVAAVTDRIQGMKDGRMTSGALLGA
jgi:putative ABC transport system ATP-binding protein